MNNDIFKRNEKIYLAHKVGVDDEYTASQFGLKVSTVKKIVSNHSKIIKQRDETMDDLYVYLKSNLKHNIATSVYHALQRYISNRSIYTKEDLKELIASDIKIRNIGPKSIEILRKYFELD